MSKIVENITNAPRAIQSFFGSVITELRKTEFPTRKTSTKLAAVVLMGSVIMSFLLYGIDYLFVIIRNYLTNLK